MDPEQISAGEMNSGYFNSQLINFIIGWLPSILFLLMTYNLVKFITELDCDLSLKYCEIFHNTESGDSKFLRRTMCYKLPDKVVWITGASSGIGEHLALELAKQGYNLVLSGRDLSRLIQVKINCVTKSDLLDEEVMVVPFDVKDIHKHQTLFDEIIAYFGKVNIFVNNAGRSQRALFETIDIEVDRDIFENNVFGGLNLSRILTRHWLKQKASGHIVVTSSIVGKTALPNCSSYTASKHALHGYYEGLRMESFDEKLKVTMVCSGPVKTGIIQNSYSSLPGETLGTDLPDNSSRMSPRRHAILMRLAIENQLEEVWITKNPFLIFCYFNQYFPTLSKRYLLNFARFLSAARDK
ncbi:dehydrogenase/reductase SDR family member 7-like isoform X2 [Brevipalpus obovatus]|uniref:dehydrogenase/reductase SDR family member 7-like isoform X2 n=1 Tax=Brevipalpus obovatus TaxID=246614 RepID=UPI003D9E9B84